MNTPNTPNFAEHGLPESQEDLLLQHGVQKLLGCRFREWLQIKHLYEEFLQDARAELEFIRAGDTRELESPRTEIGPDMHVEYDDVYCVNHDIKKKILDNLKNK